MWFDKARPNGADIWSCTDDEQSDYDHTIEAEKRTLSNNKFTIAELLWLVTQYLYYQPYNYVRGD